MNLTRNFYQYAATNPDRLALVVQEGSYSYAELATRVARIAGWIRQVAQGENRRIGILASRSPEAYLGILATAWAGATYVPLNPRYPAQRLADLTQCAQLDALIIDASAYAQLTDELRSTLPAAILSPLSAPAEQELRGIPPLASPVSVSAEALAYLMFTSGTTGKPKGIMVSVGNVRHLLDTLNQRYAITPDDRLSQFFELTFDLSVFDIFMAFDNGASLHVVPENCLMAPVRFIRQQQLSIWFSVPSLIGMLDEMKLLKADSLPGLRLSLFCGEALTAAGASVWRQAACRSRVENLYGPTEATVACLVQDCADPAAITDVRGIVAIGKPFAGHQAAILDADRTFLPAGSEGELAVSGPQVTPGYWQNLELTEARFPRLAHPIHGTTRWYLTGDRASMDETGRFHFLGRIDNQIKIRGFRIELDEVEFHLREISGIANAVALAWPLRDGVPQGIIAIIETGEGPRDNWKQAMRERVPHYLVPTRFLCLKTMPRNTSGKIDRLALLEMLNQGELR